MTTFHYQVYGLTIESVVSCPELPAGEPPADVRVRYGEVPASLGVSPVPSVPFEATPDRFLLRVAGVANYLVSRGSEVVVDRASGVEEGRVRLYLLGAVFGALFHQRGTLVLHGSAIETPRGAVVFAAPSGSGKSTLARAFLARGYRALADDICAISFAMAGHPVVAPGYPQMKLWADAAEMLEEGTESFEKVLGDRDKYIVPIPDSFCSHSLPLHAVYVLDTSSEELMSERLEGVDRFDALVRDTYRAGFLDVMDAQRSHFRNVVAAATAVPISRVSYPRDLHRLAETVDRIEADFTD